MPRELSKLESVQVTLFTRDYGAVPSWAYSASCRGEQALMLNDLWLMEELGCNTRYYPNYYVHAHRECRTYYPMVKPLVLQTAMHRYVEMALCEHFTLLMMTAWLVPSYSGRIINT